MKKLGISVFWFFLFLTGNTVLWADHLVGTDISYVCIGRDSFLVKMTIYRDCNGIPMGSEYLNVFCKSTNVPITQKTIGKPNGIDITPTCGGSCTRCSSPSCSFPYGIEQYIYQTLIVLNNAGSCCEVVLNYYTCCRSANITTGMTWANYDSYAILNRCISPCDNSPTFTNYPVAIICVQQDFVFNHGGQDIDIGPGGVRDSLHYEWSPPMGTAYNSPLSYTSPYDYKHPIYFYGFPNDMLSMPRGLHLDPLTGDIAFRPMKAEVTVMALKVSEYRNGVKIGEIRRDMQIIVINCPTNHPPTLGPNVYYKEVCAGSPVSFGINTNDIDVQDTVQISWNKGISGATWTDNNGTTKHPTGNFSWTPGENQASSIPYTFTVTAKDNSCPVAGSYTHSYQVLVKPIPEAAITITDSGCGTYWFSARATKGSGPLFTWIGGDFTFNPMSTAVTHHKFTPGLHPWTMTITAQGCSRTYRDTLLVDTFLYLEPIKKMDVCKGTRVSINPQYKYNVGKVKFSWSTSVNDTGKSNSLVVSRDTVLWVQLIDSIKCRIRDSIYIWGHSKPSVNDGSDLRMCAFGHAEAIANYSFDRSAKKSIAWTKFPSLSIIGNTDTLDISDSGTYITKVTDTLGCSNTDTVKVAVNPQVIASALGTTICSGDKTFLSADSTGSMTGNVVYQWFDPAGKLIAQAKKIQVSPLITTTYTLKVFERINGVTCRDSVPVKVLVNPLPVIKIGTIPQRCMNGTVLMLDNYVTVDGSYRPGGIWTSPSPGLYYGDRFDPVISGIGNFKVKYSYTNNSTLCHNSDSSFVTVNSLPKVNAGPDDSVCTGGGKYLLKGNPSVPPGIWRGTGVGGATGSFTFDPASPGIYDGGQYPLIYKYTDIKGCTNEDTFNMSVFRTPTVDAGPDKNTCIDAGWLDLSGNPAGGTWTGPGVKGNQFDPSDSGIGTWQLTYTFTNIICSGNDKMAVTVHPLPTLTVATGDGKSQYCSNDGIIDLVGTPAGGTWSGTGVSGSTFDPSICTVSETTYDLTYRYSDKWGCTNTKVLKIHVRPAPSVLIDKTSSKLCFGNPYSIKASYNNAEGILWSKSVGSDGVIMGSPTDIKIGYNPGPNDRKYLNFRLFITTTHKDNVCQPAFDSVKVALSAMPEPGFVAIPREGCAPLTVDFNDTSKIKTGSIQNLEWDFGDGQNSSSQNPQHIYENPGIYSIKLRAVSDAGCDTFIFVKQYIMARIVPDAQFLPKPEIALVSVPTIKFINQTLNESPGIRWSWNFNDNKTPGGGFSSLKDPEYKFSDTGRYSVVLRAVNEYGCMDSSTRIVIIMPDVIAYIPTAFRPGGKNDVFRVIVDGILSFDLKIYSRWGQLLYESTDYQTHGWKGTYLNSDEKVPGGVYVYILMLKGLDGVDYKYSGTVTLLR